MKADEIGLLEDPLDIIRHLDPLLLRIFRRRQRIVSEHLHVESAGHLGHGHADPPEADQAQDLAVELISRVFLAVPGPGFETVAGGDHVAAHGQHQRHRVLGGAERIAPGRVHHKDSLAGRLLDVDIVHPHAGPGDALELARISQNLRRDFGVAADDQPVILADDRGQLVFADPRLDDGLDAVGRVDDIDSFPGQFVSDQNFHHTQHSRNCPLSVRLTSTLRREGSGQCHRPAGSQNHEQTHDPVRYFRLVQETIEDLEIYPKDGR